MREFLGIQYIRDLAPIYSHRVPGFKKTQIGFDPIQKRNPNLKRKVKTHLSVDRPVDRPMPRSTALVDRLQPRLGSFQSVDWTGRPRTRVSRSAARPTDAFRLLFGFKLLFCFGVESNRDFLNSWDSLTINMS